MGAPLGRSSCEGGQGAADVLGKSVIPAGCSEGAAGAQDWGYPGGLQGGGAELTLAPVNQEAWSPRALFVHWFCGCRGLALEPWGHLYGAAGLCQALLTPPSSPSSGSCLRAFTCP